MVYHPQAMSVSFQSIRPMRGARLLVVLLAVLSGAGGSVVARPPRFEAVLVNGGGTPRTNYRSHLAHIETLLDLLRDARVRSSRITIFSADGTDPQADLAAREVQSDIRLIEGTVVGNRLRNKVALEDGTIDGVTLRPATRRELRVWFEDAASRLRPGDTLLLYVTDHGTLNDEDPSDNEITLWGEDQSLSVSDLAKLLTLLDDGVRVVSLMSQCYSGAFANLMDADFCGFFSSTDQRPAYGCYPENLDRDGVGHSFRFLEALRADPVFSAAHERVLVTDKTPDVPTRTSDVYLERLLDDAAAERRLAPDDLIDELLLRAWRDKGAWEPQIRLLDRVAQIYGLFSPRSLAELQEQADLLPELSREFERYGRAWRLSLHALNAENLTRFLDDHLEWKPRVEDEAVQLLDDATRRELTADLLTELARYVSADPVVSQRLELLAQRTDGSAAARYRMQVRLGVVLRMRAILIGIAGRVYLSDEATPAQRERFAQLADCEGLSLKLRRSYAATEIADEAFPSYVDDVELARRVLPGWMGIRFRPAGARLRAKRKLESGATEVVAVFPDSPAEAAGLRVGDIVVGPPDEPFIERERLREWVMTAPIGEPSQLRVRRDGEELSVTLIPAPYPLDWPTLRGPPEVGSVAPTLDDVRAYRGELPDGLDDGGPYLLYFWATWCAPCKAAVPEILAYERDRATRVIAITDESAAQLEPFFKTRERDFPETVVLDPRRRAFLSYGVNGTPFFVLVGKDGKVVETSIGYDAARGLRFDGWSWPERQTDGER